MKIGKSNVTAITTGASLNIISVLISFSNIRIGWLLVVEGTRHTIQFFPRRHQHRMPFSSKLFMLRRTGLITHYARNNTVHWCSKV